MRRLLFALALSLASVTLMAQEAPQRGRIKKFDVQAGTVTITTQDGKDIEAAIVAQTQFRNADNETIANIR